MPQAVATVDHAGENGNKVNFDALLETAQAMQTTIRELLAQCSRLIMGLKAHHRSMKTMRDTFAGLRELGQIEV